MSITSLSDWLPDAGFCDGCVNHTFIFIDNLPEDLLLKLNTYKPDKCEDLNWMVIKYDAGSVLPIHKDIQILDHHSAALLVYPPASMLPIPLVGGDLLVYDCDHTVSATIIPSTVADWTRILIPLGIEHEVTPIISGNRYVFKAEIYDQ